MMDRFYNGQSLLEEYSAFGEFEINQMSRVARIRPFVQQRLEVIVDSSVPDDVDLEDVPPHLKQTLELFFVNSPAIYPTKFMIQCSEPGKLQSYNGRSWVDIPYRDVWVEWEEYVKEMDNIHYPFVVLPNTNMHPRTWNLLEDSKMRLFKTLLDGNHRQVTLREFESTWIHLFNPVHADNPELPIAAWLTVSGTAAAYVDVIEIDSNKQARIVFTVPPIMSLNEGETSIMDGKTPINIQNIVMRCRSESAVVPLSGDQRFLETFTNGSGEAKNLSKHAQMWKIIYDRYGWEFTSGDNTVSSQTNLKVSDGTGTGVDDQMDDIVF